jgi:predicted enzyme related to lactoylglutathione lyase
MASFTLTYVNLGAPDPRLLASFYARLLDWPVERDDPGFVLVRNPAGGVGLACQQEIHHQPPMWPAGPGAQQMQAHLEVRVDNLAAAVKHALDCGATLAAFQPQDNVRVCLDPAGHPFCLYLD